MVTTSLYIARVFSQYLVMVFLICSGITMFFDTVELIRVTHSIQISLIKIIKMAAMKNYCHFHKIWLFIILVTSVLTYNKLTKNFELIAIKSLGISIWKILFPSMIISALVGIIHFSILNPVSASLMKSYQHFEAINLKGQKSLISLSKSGLWLKVYDKGYLEIIHGARLSPNTKEIFDFTIYRIDKDGKFVRRTDAEKAKLEDNSWFLTKVNITDTEYEIEKIDSMRIPTNIKFSQISSSLIPPNAISFWRMQHFIDLTQTYGFLALHYKLYFMQLLLSPLLFASVAFFGYSFGSSHPRNEKRGLLMTAGVGVGFFIYFLGDFISALSLSGSIPIIIAVFVPIVLFFILGWYSILNKEFYS